MEKFTVGNGQYVIYAKDVEQARYVISQELQRVDKIREKMANLLSQDGVAMQNFMKNTSKENLNIYFYDETSLIYDDLKNATTKGEVRQRSNENGKFTYDLAYRYPEIQGHNADFRLAHEMGHLMLNPSNTRRQTYDKETDTRQVSGLMRVPRGQERNLNAIYGTRMQENAINLIAELAIRGEHSADDIISGKVDVSEFNLYKKCDDLVKLLAVSMRNDFENEMSFEQLVENKIDSFIEHSDGSKEPANTFFYGVLNDSSIIENEFDKYMGKGAWRDLDTFISNLHNTNISKEQFDMVFKEAQRMIIEFANARMQEKYKEAVARNGQSVPTIANKINMINEMTGIELEQVQESIDIQPTESKLTLKQKVAQFLQKNNLFMNLSFVEKFVHKQLDILPAHIEIVRQTNAGISSRTRENFINQLTNFGKYRNLPTIQKMSDPEKIAQMRRKMEQKEQNNDDSERG